MFTRDEERVLLYCVPYRSRQPQIEDLTPDELRRAAESAVQCRQFSDIGRAAAQSALQKIKRLYPPDVGTTKT